MRTLVKCNVNLFSPHCHVICWHSRGFSTTMELDIFTLSNTQPNQQRLLSSIPSHTILLESVSSNGYLTFTLLTQSLCPILPIVCKYWWCNWELTHSHFIHPYDITQKLKIIEWRTSWAPKRHVLQACNRTECTTSQYTRHFNFSKIADRRRKCCLLLPAYAAQVLSQEAAQQWNGQ